MESPPLLERDESVDYSNSHKSLLPVAVSKRSERHRLCLLISCANLMPFIFCSNGKGPFSGCLNTPAFCTVNDKQDIRLST